MALTLNHGLLASAALLHYTPCYRAPIQPSYLSGEESTGGQAMPILVTPRQHFNEDLARSRALKEHAAGQGAGEIRNDIMRAAWMMGVGASDAYFCDAYADLVARTLQAKHLQPSVVLPDRILNLKVPVISVVRAETTENWRWRMAARGLIEDQSVNRREIVTPDRRQILTPYSRCLKRQESFPVSMISQ